MKMALLKLIENDPNINFLEYRDNLFYNKYTYRLKCRVEGGRYTYFCKTTEDLDSKLNNPKKSYMAIRANDVPKVQKNLPALKEIIKLSNERKLNKNFSLRIERDHISFFADDINLLKEIENRLGTNYTLDFTKAEIAPFAGVKYFVNEPKHKYRVYLKTTLVDTNLHKDLTEFISRVKGVYASPGLKKWLNHTRINQSLMYFRYTSSAYFLDYDDESTLSYLALIHGKLLGRKYKLEKRPDPI